MILLISGPSGAGKTTFVRAPARRGPARALLGLDHHAPDPAREREGVDYHYVDNAEFDRLVDAGAFVEWAHVHDRRYGTRRDHIQAMIDRGEVPLLDLDVQGGKNVIDLYRDELVSVFVFPPSWDALERACAPGPPTGPRSSPPACATPAGRWATRPTTATGSSTPTSPRPCGACRRS
ncbi:MAG: hypothetical protein IPM94_15285 [bacterium]|nr:hypothetical protein [bacterium]